MSTSMLLIMMTMALIFLGMFSLSLSMEKHHKQILSSAFSSKKLIIFRILGWTLLVLSMYTNILAFNVTIGIATWFGIATFITGLMIYLFSYRIKWVKNLSLAMIVLVAVICVLYKFS